MDSEVEGRDSLVYNSEEEARRLQPPDKRKKAMAGAATYLTKFKMSGRRSFRGFRLCLAICIASYVICCVSILCDHQGKGDVKAYCKSTGHLHRAGALGKQPRLDCNPKKADLDKSTTEAEVKMASLVPMLTYL